MAKLILVTGGARSGKSTLAESLVKENRIDEDVFYVATGVSCDEEMKERIKHHRQRRSKDWKTLEKYKGFAGDDFSPQSFVVLECLGTLTANFFMDEVDDYDHMTPEEGAKIEEKVLKEIDHFLEITRQCKTVILVTNEIGMGMMPMGAGNRYYVDTLGRLNQKIARKADKVYWCLSGIPVEVK